MRNVLAGFILVFSLSGTAAQPQAGIGVAPRDPNGAGVPPSVTSRAASASAAARGARAFVTWLNGIGLGQTIQRSLREADPRIAQLLRTSGQPGVLYLVEIQRAQNETAFRSLVGDGVQLIGAGTSAEDVAIAVSQTDRLRPAPRDGYMVVQEESVYLWIARQGNQFSVSTYPAIGISNRVLRARSDAAFLAAYNGQSTQRALQAAVAHFEARSVNAQAKRRMAELQRQLAEQEAQVTQIRLRLERELERARKAESVARTLSLLANVLTLAQQVAEFKAAYGAEAPASVDVANNPSDLVAIANEMASGARTRGRDIQIQLDQWQDRASGTRRERLLILETERYPLNEIPQLRLP